MDFDSDVSVGDGVSVLHSDGHRYECKVKKVDDAKVHLRWHGFGKSSDFSVDLGSDTLGPLEDADVLPPPPTRSLKLKVGRAPSTSAGVTDNQKTGSDSDEDQSSHCTHCSRDVMEAHLKCDFCSRPSHLSCSGLPDYMLVRFLKSETGFMCEACVKSRWSPDKISDAQHTISNTKEKEAEQQVADPKHTVLSSAPPYPQKAIPICHRYRRGQCPHGLKGKKLVEGKKCAYAHPPKCPKFLSAGNDKRYGCGQGKRCKFLHPILCRSSGKGDGVCSSGSCKLVHPKRARRNNGCPDSRSSHSRATTVINSVNNGENTNRKAPTTTSTPSKNDQLERIEQTILSMKATYDKELKALRQQLSQTQSPPMPWMVPNYPWMTPPFGGPTLLTSFQQQVPTSYSNGMQHSSF